MSKTEKTNYKSLSVLKFLKNSKKDILALGLIEIAFLAIISVIYICADLQGRVYSSVADSVSQYIPLSAAFRNLFYQNHELIPQFIAHLGGGQNAFNFTYYGIGNPLVWLSYFFPFLNMFTFWTILMVLIIAVSIALLYIWLRRRFSIFPTCLAVLVFIVAEPIIYHTHYHYMFIDYFPFLILALFGVDRFFESDKFFEKKLILLVISVSLIALISYFYLPGCFIAIMLYAVFVWFEKNPIKKIHKKLILDMLQIIGCLLFSLALVMAVLIPTCYAILGANRGVVEHVSIGTLLLPNFEGYLNSDPRLGPFSLGIGLVALIIIAFNLSFKNLKLRVLTVLFLAITLIPFFRWLANGTIYLYAKSLIPLLPIACLLISYSFVYVDKIFREMKSVYRRPLLCFLSVALLFSIASASVYINTPSDPAYPYPFLLKENVDSHRVDSEIDSQIDRIKSDNIIYRSSTIPAANMPIMIMDNRVFSDNYYSKSVYSSTVTDSWRKYLKDYLWTPISFLPFDILSKESPLSGTMLGVKYLHRYPEDNPPAVAGYNQKSLGLDQNENAFSIGYATDKTFSDIHGFSDQQAISSVISGIAVDGNLDAKNYPDTSNLKSVDLSHIFDTVSGGKMNFKLDNGRRYTYKLPVEIKDRVLFVKISLPKRTDVNIVISINKVESCYVANTHYDNDNNELRFAISPDDADKISDLRLTINHEKYDIKNIEAFTMPVSDLLNAYKQFDQMKVKSFDTSGLKGDINITQPNSTIAFSIPYDNGFTLKVDGKQTDISQVNGGIIGANIDKGHHEIELTYEAPGFKIGIIISVISLFLLICFCGIKVFRKRKYNA
ncbi:MAG: YfhO family protein [Bifidobacteriaceae bacterium]|jgi:uncharacterized membrane protein YfhO|nr:YfhO family protein [Bifidobacteriaceae bacterium]